MWINVQCEVLIHTIFFLFFSDFLLFASRRSDNFVRVHGGRSEGRVGDEPAQAGRQRHRLGRPELWEVSVISVWVGSPPTGFCLRLTQIYCVGFFLNLRLHVEFPVTHSWSSVFTAAGPQWVWLLVQRSSLNVCGLFVMKLMSLQMHREHLLLLLWIILIIIECVFGLGQWILYKKKQKKKTKQTKKT